MLVFLQDFNSFHFLFSISCDFHCLGAGVGIVGMLGLLQVVALPANEALLHSQQAGRRRCQISFPLTRRGEARKQA